MNVFLSRFTPSLEDGENVKFNIGEKVLYKQSNGQEIDVIIDSEYMKHNSGTYGYEATFPDDGERYFILSNRIIDWDGKGEEVSK